MAHHQSIGLFEVCELGSVRSPVIGELGDRTLLDITLYVCPQHLRCLVEFLHLFL